MAGSKTDMIFEKKEGEKTGVAIVLSAFSVISQPSLENMVGVPLPDVVEAIRGMTDGELSAKSIEEAAKTLNERNAIKAIDKVLESPEFKDVKSTLQNSSKEDPPRAGSTPLSKER